MGSRYNNKENVYLCINRACAVYSNNKVVLYLSIMIGTRDMINISEKLGLVINNSTEIEVVTNRKRFPKCTKFRYFRLI